MRHPTNRLPVPALRNALLEWYDREGRALPWRVRPEDRARGARPDPYAVWLSEIMLQQTTVSSATPYYRRFLARWPTVQDLAAADRDDVLAAWAGLGYYARARNLFACAGAVADAGGEFPSSEEALLALPGVGPYTAAAIRAVAFDAPANVVDGNVERVVARLHAVGTPLPQAKAELKALAAALADPRRPGDYAQAIMDLGATVCSPKSPECTRCPLSRWCQAHEEGLQADYPRRAARTAGPVRRGVAFLVVRGGEIWLRRRPERGLLGGMMEVPSTPWRTERWDDGSALDRAPFRGDWEPCGEVRHVFTHFTLRIDVWRAPPPPAWAPDEGGFHALDGLSRVGLPSLMIKVVKAGKV
ncbi:A/G-specific adenine glycosylase [bacterium]|nr:A/G-specific adenine glycosylase [bacterium]MBU1074250.1 A/G-specific adenine glycosylase [bacterium]MBU1676624.1 A/G-specific adenine glycosylase [bacterium]